MGCCAMQIITDHATTTSNRQMEDLNISQFLSEVSEENINILHGIGIVQQTLFVAGRRESIIKFLRK